MSEHQSSYRQIFKATSIFGGVQIINILISIIRSKIVAVLLGPAGMGVMGLFTSTIGLITAATNFGLGTSAVKDIAAADGTGDTQKISQTVTVFRKLIWLTGALGMIITLVLAPLWSKLTFGNYNYTWSFIVLSISLLIEQLASGQAVVLQGLRKISWLAKAGVIGSVIGLIMAWGLFYFFGEKGIVPVIILGYLTSLVVQGYFSKKIKLQSFKISIKEAIEKGKPMLKLGFLISLSGFITIAFSYILRIYLNRFGGFEVVGLYNAGFTIINVYVGLVFSAMATDYYPRLSAIKDNNKQQNMLITQQAEMALFILSPMIMVFLVFITVIINILYSSKFLPVVGMVHWAVLGIYFKALSWSIAFQVLAKGDSKAFFWNELIANIYLLIFNIVGYYLDGLTGLGISFLVGYIIYAIQMYIFCTQKYSMEISVGFWKIFGIYFSLGVLGFILASNLNGILLYSLGILLILLVTGISIYFLNKKIALFEFIKSKLKK